ncbi:MAG TPA: prepilin-type N-terminal cleavage/methylation domain-containing protein [Sulfuricurvum sp.]|nr:MAG: hypothetical protein B7Y30_09030 [Campylobacterales bacterium 16-40-21]OZA02777.1 MAG: hypothetical protein B7X89_07545 [Sulfuricurvum sp. 17-40-25]HQS67480.1 prepilin-type N-terminal cleavage/methylation domain-containing protein [Sulfuricurvum sp.]HQT36867.1 prepilin-type N-terminal cleavage/methylation domain-containing protein [Sulfuricurvum sp.]
MKRLAFTLLELVFVLIVIGILAVLAMPNFRGHPLQDAAEQVASHIRYTQHLAMVDDKYDPTDSTWYERFWRIRFYESGTPDTYYYAVFHDTDKENNIDTTTHTEPAIDPLTKKYLYVGNSPTDARNNKRMNLTDTYGITNIVSTCDAGWIEFFFDNTGRPYVNSISTGVTPPYSGLLQNDCNITLSHVDGNATITIRPETGYVSVTYP